ncbi:AAA family ATPase [Methylobacillus gramineus]|uniref:Lon protease family protein n=1 Tax=Methylobacillus gramineus TaxID=755169 RepID=UPI001CFFCD03|nr:AAA family ATPase [Methylobacillus gramineus]MCB5184105.1 AAA family ATPase [Methylobacillus gramineus]
MHHTLSPQQLTREIAPPTLGFSDTSELVAEARDSAGQWIGQQRAAEAAQFGLRMAQPGYHMLVIGEPGSGRTSLLLRLLRQASASHAAPTDLVCLLNFTTPEKPLLLRLVAGKGAELRLLLEQFVRRQIRAIPGLVHSERLPKTPHADPLVHPDSRLKTYLEEELATIRQQVAADLLQPQVFDHWIQQLVQEVVENMDVFITTANSDAEGMQEAFLSRFRANLLVNNGDVQGAPVIYDDDPGYQTLFGGIESAGEQGHVPDFMRLKAGNILRADGGCLVLHLEDILQDQQGSHPLLDKLGRVLRNRKVQIEDSGSGAGQGTLSSLLPDALPVDFKLILIASREDYYHLHEEHPEFLEHFRIKIDFAESVTATPAIYRQLACHIAQVSDENRLPHFTAAAVARLLQTMHGWAEDQMRLSLNIGALHPLILESAAFASPNQLVGLAEVDTAINTARSRHDYAEQQIRESILDGELMIQVQGREVGQINGLTHIDMGDVAFGSPVRISARCYPGRDGIINIDREVEMTGPQHDKGLFIMQSWLAANFANLAPLSLNASIVFEQEYHGVEGDSASCAELYALLSTLSGLPLPQGVAVTGALNQHGEVLPIGGINEKIEGHFRLCEKFGLDGKQGVLVPARNLRHLLLSDDVINAVEQKLFHIHAIDYVLEGIEYLTGMPVGSLDELGDYRPDTVLGRVQRTLESYRTIYKANRSLRQESQ